MSRPVLTVKGLGVRFGENRVVADVNLELWAGRMVGLVGESGCGKSTTALASLGYVPPGGVIESGVSDLEGVDLLSLGPDRLRSVWGKQVAYLAQSAGSALNPSLTVGAQIEYPLRRHTDLDHVGRQGRKLELMESVGMPLPHRALDRYPHQFSGGQQQRIALAIALACRPRVLVLDEPTTGLDVTTQATVSELLADLVSELGVAALYVSHDIALLSGLVDHLVVMYAGRVVEEGATIKVTASARHPYTSALLDAVPTVTDRVLVRGIAGEPPGSVVIDSCAFAPRCAHAADNCRQDLPRLEAVGEGHHACCLRLDAIGAHVSQRVVAVDKPADTAPAQGPLLELEGVVCSYGSGRQRQVVVDQVSLSLRGGETVGVVGESGSGKSTLLRAIAGLHQPDSGRLRFKGESLPQRVRDRSFQVRRQIQLVFQDPASSLNPRETVYQAILRPLRFLGEDLDRSQEQVLVESLLADVRLPRFLSDRYPWELSGGQQQRVAISRALALRPSLLLCDEVTSALDVSVQASIIELLADIVARHDLGVVFVSHDLAVVRSLVDRVLVMKDGAVCEAGQTEEVFRSPRHPYTVDLLEAIPTLRVSA